MIVPVSNSTIVTQPPGRLDHGCPAVFLDKDGTLVRNVPYNVSTELTVLVPEAIKSLLKLHQRGFKLVVVSNQSGLAMGHFAEPEVGVLQQHLEKVFLEAGVPLAGFYYCPHHPAGTVEGFNITCSCRKPLPGMLLRAARDHDINLAASWMVGDILHDVEAGNSAGCRTILVDVGNETEWQRSPARMPDYIAENLLDAAGFIIGETSFPNPEQDFISRLA